MVQEIDEFDRVSSAILNFGNINPSSHNCDSFSSVESSEVDIFEKCVHLKSLLIAADPRLRTISSSAFKAV